MLLDLNMRIYSHLYVLHNIDLRTYLFTFITFIPLVRAGHREGYAKCFRKYLNVRTAFAVDGFGMAHGIRNQDHKITKFLFLLVSTVTSIRCTCMQKNCR